MDKSFKNIKEFAHFIGVSPTTISRVLAGKSKQYRIGKQTAERVTELAKKHNFQLNQIASGLRLKRTKTLGLIIPDISNLFFATMAREIETEARKKGYSIILIDSEEKIAIEKQAVQLLMSRKADGLIICPIGSTSKHLEEIFNANYPVVIVDRYFKQSKIPYVSSNNYQAAYQAVNHLIQNGHSKIACIQGAKQTITNKDRVRGYIAAHAENVLTVNEKWIIGDNYGIENGYRCMKKLIKGSIAPTAIFATSNLISIGALKAILEARLRVPNDISIVSFDEQPYSDILFVPMTTIQQQQKEIGKKAVCNLLQMIDTEMSDIPESLVLPTKLIVRKSVKKLL